MFSMIFVFISNSKVTDQNKDMKPKVQAKNTKAPADDSTKVNQSKVDYSNKGKTKSEDAIDKDMEGENSVDIAVVGFVFHCVLIGIFSCFSTINDYTFILLSYILMFILVVFMQIK